MAEIRTSSIQSGEEDFELEAAKIRTKIQTYFSHLVEVIILRRTKLISELDGIVSHYRQERGKIREMEEKRRNEEGRYIYSDGKLHDKLSDIETELSELLNNSTKFIEFEWNRKYAREASAIGKLKIRSLSTMKSEQNYARIKTKITQPSGTSRKIFPNTFRDGDHEISAISNSNEQTITSIQARPNYKRYTDISPDTSRDVPIDNRFSKQIRPPPYNPGYSEHTATKRLCLEGCSAHRHRADGADRSDRPDYIDTVTQIKFEL